MSDISEYYI